MRASQGDGTYPRPQLRREAWLSLDGHWEFTFDGADRGRDERWFRPDAGEHFNRQILVPFPPESAASGVADLSPQAVLWYRRQLDMAKLDMTRAGTRPRVLLHFGAVDHSTDVWVDGQHVGSHTGGQSPFTIDITRALHCDTAPHFLVVRAEDDFNDVSQPRGKQTWRKQPNKVWYERTSGIWQSVWMEAVPDVHITELWWQTDPDTGVTASLELSAAPTHPTIVSVTLELDGRRLGYAAATITGRRVDIRVPIYELANAIEREDLEWTPEHPILVDAQISLTSERGEQPADQVLSYLGIRTVGVGGGHFLINGRPYYLRGILNQGYRPQTLIANYGTEELRAEIELAKSMGFNMMRIHQKVEDPRILYWADRLGMLIWTEIGSAYEFSATAVQNLLTEWTATVRRDRSHPSVAAWVPINESWGLANLRGDSAQRAFSTGIAHLTRALDPSRPTMSNEGWEHTDSDILGVHDYTTDHAELIQRYSNADAVAGLIRSASNAAGGRAIAIGSAQIDKFKAGNAPLMITEFGGLSLRPSSDDFAYTNLQSDADFTELLEKQFDALRACDAVVGFCYTQLLDTAQETNGLADEHGKPKLPIDTLRSIVTGTAD